MDDFNESADKAIEEQERERIDLALLAMSLPTKGKYRDDLKFPKETKAALKSQFIAIRKERAEHDVPDYFLEGDADGFVSMLERFAQGMEKMAAGVPDKQKRRVELLSSLSKHATRLAEVLEQLDGDALGWMLATFDQSGELMKDPFRAVTLAREQRHDLVELLPRLSTAAQKASETLPSHDFQLSDPKFSVTLQLDRLFYDNLILDLFTPSKGGFAFVCLRAVFDLAEYFDGDPYYWIKKVREHEKSMTSWIEGQKSR
ncbi:hypothetical protein GXB81_23015 [Paraburkholderia sp. Ac-20336]|uniref:hypothetical protein n=1 Tax=Paraburkholderia sp. Ac-20336 TaxID=2703886 RepID=UPI00197DB7EB|nr:hypothetical protein [Paraburkholderia sp. Ac-20336]MBN3805900.1 hypothetical protein [Paraburkholderia sp. Ac-20336]